MTHELTTFHDGLLSIYQSAVEQLAHNAEGKDLAPGKRPGLENQIIAAGAAAAAKRMRPAAGRAPAAAALPDKLNKCAERGLQYLEALARGDTARAQEYKFDDCDLDWAKTLKVYAQYLGAPIPYIRAPQIRNPALNMKPNARVALIGDWGTGTDAAKSLLQSVKRQNPDVVIHLGDVYYSGTEAECKNYFLQIVNEDLAGIPVYTIPGNHDMYAAGSGFYWLIKQLNINSGAEQQPASFFCLRSTDGNWQFVAMDTGLHDRNPFKVTDVLTWLEKDEEDWHVQRIKEFAGRTILLSHHQLFSAFSQIGPPDANGNLHPCNPYLLESFSRFKYAGPGRIAAWFWGHEHNLCIYKPYAGLQCGRCIGHGAIPVFDTDSPYEVRSKLTTDPPELLEDTKLTLSGGIYAHGYVVISFNGPAATADYFQSTSDKPSYSEKLPAPVASPPEASQPERRRSWWGWLWGAGRVTSEIIRD